MKTCLEYDTVSVNSRRVRRDAGAAPLARHSLNAEAERTGYWRVQMCQRAMDHVKVGEKCVTDRLDATCTCGDVYPAHLEQRCLVDERRLNKGVWWMKIFIL